MLMWLALAGAFDVALAQGGEAVVNLTIENQTDTLLKAPWIFVFSKPDWLSVSPDSVITRNLARGEKIEVQLRLRSELSWFPALREGDLRLRVLVRNGELAPDFVDFKVKEEPAELASLVPWLLAREYEFTHTLTEHYDYYPIVFLHGTLTLGSYWKTADPRGSVMTRLAGYNGYRLYSNGNTFDAEAALAESSTVDSFYPKRWAFNISYYWWESGARQPGAADSKGTILPCDDLVRGNYQMNLNYTIYGKVVATRIDEILNATYSDRVNIIVAHSYGSLVARTAMKWYNCKDKVGCFLSIAGVNHPIDESVAQNIAQFFLEILPGEDEIPGWWRYGDRAEMEKDILFSNVPEECTSGKPYPDFLGEDWAGSVHYATIAGTIDPTLLHIGNEDGLVNTETVYLAGADFNATHRSTHGSCSARVDWLINTFGEFSLTASEYSLEFIKTWIIDRQTSRVGTGLNVYDVGPLGSVWNCADTLYIVVEMAPWTFKQILSAQATLITADFAPYASSGCSYRQMTHGGGNYWLFRFFGGGQPAYTIYPGFNWIRFTLYTLDGIAYETEFGIWINCGGK